MADKEIGALTSAGALDGSELVHIVQGGDSRQATTQDIADLGGGGSSLERTRTVPAVASFTLENAGTASMADVTSGIKLTTPSASSNIRFIRSNAGVPGGTWSLITRAVPMSPRNFTTVYQRCIIARNSTSGRILIFGDYDKDQELIQRWTNYTTFSAGAYGPQVSTHIFQMPWMRMKYDGTNLIFGRSPDGYTDTFHDYHTEPVATFLTASGGTLDQIGLGTCTVAPGVTAEALFQSFEVV